MFAVIQVYLDGATDPVEVTPLAAYVWEYEEAGGTAEFGLRLWCAFSQIQDRSPSSLDEVKAWAKAHKVMAMIGRPVDPTQTEAGSDSSPE